MRAHIRLLITITAFLIPLSGCDNFSLLDGFDRFGGLSLTAASPSIEQGGSTELYAAGGKPPYSWMLVEKDLVYIDSGNKLGSITGTVYTAGNSIGAITVRIRDGAGNTKDAEITVVPPPPTGLGITFSAPKTLTLTWTFANTAQISSFVVFRSMTGGPFAEAATPGQTETTFVNDTGLLPSTSYTYYLQAVNGPYRSRPTALITATTN